MENNLGIANLDIHNIVTAFQMLANSTTSKQSIRTADIYIHQCQNNPYFSLALINILTQLPNSQTKFQILIHLKIVIKRNWTSNRRSNQPFILTKQIKEEIKSKLLDLYKFNWKIYYKQFNQIFKELSRFDFPSNYSLLNNFVLEVLTSLSALSIQQILNSEQLLPYLSLVKVIYKQFGKRRILHTAQNYNKYIGKNVQISVNIMQKINQALLSVKANLDKVDLQLVQKLLECSRKIDKIILYCLQCIVSDLQFDNNITQIIKFQLGKIQTLLSINSGSLNQLVQLNILAILQGVSKLQQFFPLLFTQFLYQYLQLIIQLLINQNLKQQKLINCIINANIKPLKTFTYYMDQQQYKQTLQYRMGNARFKEKYQDACHKAFITVYTSENVSMFLEKIVGDLMVRYPRINEEDQIIFEDAQQNYQSNQQGSFELLIILLKQIISLFPQQSKKFIQKLLTHLLSEPSNSNNQLSNLYQLILLLPKVLKQNSEINLIAIYNLIQQCYVNGKFDLFCRLIRNYNSYFDSDSIVKSFHILINIIGSNNISHKTVYQCAVCIKKIIISNGDLPLSFDLIGSCLVKIFQLIQIYREVPTHLWNLLNLLIQFIKTLSQQVVHQNIGQLADCINFILQGKDNGSLIICAMCDLVQNILVTINPNDSRGMNNKISLYNASINLLTYSNKKDTQQESEQIQNSLLLCLAKTINVNIIPSELKDKMLMLFHKKRESLLAQQPSLFLQILQQYLISGLLKVSVQDLISIYFNYIENSLPDNDVRTNISFFSLYFTYAILTNNIDFKLLIVCMQKLKQIYPKITPTINTFRTLLMLIINYSFILVGSDKVIALYNQYYKDYKIWLNPYVRSLEYINHRYSAKISSIALLNSIGLLKNVLRHQIEGSLPFDYVLKFITCYVLPMERDQIVRSYIISLRMFSHYEQLVSRNKHLDKNIKSRKAQLHIQANFCQLDLTPIYRKQITQVLQEWDWGTDDLQERFTADMVKNITSLLDPNHQNTTSNAND